MSQDFSKADPYFDRESQKYAEPIPSREYILQYMENHDGSVSRHDLINAFSLHTEQDLLALKRRINAMMRDGQIISNRRGRFCLTKGARLHKGVVVGLRNGRGYVEAKETKKGSKKNPKKEANRIYLSQRQMRMVFPGDEVMIRVTGVDDRGEKEGIISDILKHNTEEIAGRYFSESGIGYVEPCHTMIDQDIIVNPGAENGAKDGQYVVVKILTQPTYHTAASGEVTQILGDRMAPGLETDVILNAYQIPHIFPEKAIEESAQFPGELSEKVIRNRSLLTDLPFVTIDGEDAQDFDDAVYCEPHKKGGGWRLLVAIADVSHYVRPELALDAEALVRANSVYFPGRVVPMLPERLSNDLCSLKPYVDRLVLVCDMKIDAEGRLVSYNFKEGVIRSHARLTYTEVEHMLAGTVPKKHKELLPYLKNLQAVYHLLHKKRIERGALDFDRPETRIIFDKDHKIKQIKPTTRLETHRIIEECMLAANVSAMKFLRKAELPALYRVHEPPKGEKLDDLQKILTGFGIKIAGYPHPPTAKAFADVLRAVAERPDAPFLQLAVLRSLQQAHYSTQNKGHFGLAYPVYGHFTSPIRRYPDLMVHRVIKAHLQNRTLKNAKINEKTLEALAIRCSEMERRADEAVREVYDWLRCEYMQDKLGNKYNGIIEEVTGFGVFIMLEDLFVRGLVHISKLGDEYFDYDPQKRTLVSDSGKTFAMGNKVKVRVARVDVDAREIDFEIL